MSIIKPKPSKYPSQSQQTQITQWTNQNSKQLHVTSAKRGKTRVSKLQLVQVLLLIGRESDARCFNQSQSEVKQNQSKIRITLDTQLKTALYCHTRHWVNSWNSGTSRSQNSVEGADFLKSFSFNPLSCCVWYMVYLQLLKVALFVLAPEYI